MRFHFGWKSHFSVQSALYLCSHELRRNETQNGMDLVSVILYHSITFKWEVKWTHTGLRFQTSVKASPVYMKFHFGCISKRPIILMDMFRHFILGSVYMIFYHPKWNFISVKVTHMKSIPALSFKRTCALKSHAGLTFHFGQNDR